MAINIFAFVLYMKKLYINGLERSISCYNICIAAFMDCNIFEAR